MWKDLNLVGCLAVCSEIQIVFVILVALYIVQVFRNHAEQE